MHDGEEEPARPRPSRSVLQPDAWEAPSSADSVDIAMESVRADPQPDDEARVLLTRQAELVDADLRHRRLQISGERVAVLLRWLTVGVGVAVAGAAVAVVVSAMGARNVVVEAFDAPPALAERGLSGKVVSGGLQDAITAIQDNVRTSARTRNIANAWTGDIAVQVPQTGVSLGELDRLLRARLGHETHIGGALVQNEDKTLSLTVRATGVAPRTFTGPSDTLTQLTAQAAEYVYGRFEPRLYAIYLYQADRKDDALAFVGEALSRAPPEARPDLAWNWGNLLRDKGDYRGALSKHELALKLDPLYWRSWQGRATALKYLYGDEAARRAGDEMKAAALKAPRNRQPEPRTWVNWQLLTEDWTGQVKALRDDAAQAGGKGTFSVLSTSFLAEAEARRHDFKGALVTLDMGDQDDPALPITRDLIAGMKALDEGRAADGLAAMRSFDARWRDSAKFQFQFDRGPCVVGLANAANRLPAEAEAALRRVAGRAQCAAYEGDVREAVGNRAGADAAFARAIAAFPSLPITHQRRALARLARGDVQGADRDFAESARLGPAWADPLKGRGDVAAAQGRWKDAVALYAKAAPFAPRWGALHLAWSRALARSGKAEEARAKAALAEGMELSPADRASLARR